MRPLDIGNAEIEFAVALLMPAEMIGDNESRHLAARFERLAEIFGEPLAGPLLPVLGDHVFEACMPPIATVAMVAVKAHDGRSSLEQILRLDKSDRGREPWVGLRVVVGHPVPAAEQEIVADQPVALEQRDDCQIVGQHVDRVVLGDREADLELARQIALAVERVGLVGSAVVLLPRRAVDPDFVVAAGPRQEMTGQPARFGLQPVVHGIADRRRGCRDSAHDIAASRQCRQQRGVDLADRRFEPGLDDAVKLDALPRRDPQRPVGITVGERVEGKILLGCEPSAGDADAHHELPDLVIAALLALGRAVAVITLVDPVEFEERIALLVERGAGVGEIARDVPAQLPALLLDRFGLRDGVDLNHIPGLRGGAAQHRVTMWFR